MLDYPVPQQPSMAPADSSVRVLDVAKGVLVALRQHDADEAFEELVEASKKYAVSTFALAAALVVAAASGGRNRCGDNAEAANAVEQEWGLLLSALAAAADKRG